MPKHATEMLEDPQPPPKRRAATMIKILVLALPVPIVYEGTTILVARWKTLLGTAAYADTPILNFVSEKLSDAQQKFNHITARPLRGTFNVKPIVVVPLVVLWTGLTILLLRR
jgi:hypothetical protein